MNKTLASILLFLGFVMLKSSKWFDQDFHKVLFYGGIIISIVSYFFYHRFLEKENRTTAMLIFLGIAFMESSDFLSEPINNIASILGTTLIFYSAYLMHRRDGSLAK